MKKLLIIFLFSIFSIYCFGQTATVTATVQDPTTQVFANGTVTITFVPTPGVPGPFTVSGSPIQLNGVNYGGATTFALDGTGTFTVTMSRNDFIQPAKSQWQFVVCPNATAACTTATLSISAASPNISSSINALVPTVAVVAGSNVPRAYSNSELIITPNPGQSYWNVITNTVNFWNGSAWLQQVTPGSSPSFTGLTITGNTTMTGNTTVTGSITSGSTNGVITACQQTGSDMGAKINTALAALPTSGGTVWVDRSCMGTYGTSIAISVPVHLQFDSGFMTYNGTGSSITCAATTRGVKIEGVGQRADQGGGTLHGTVLFVAGTAVNGITSSGCPGIEIKNIELLGPSSGTGIGMKIAGHGCKIDHSKADQFGGDGIVLDGGTQNTISCVLINSSAMSNGANGFNLSTSQANLTTLIGTDAISNATNYRVDSAANVWVGTHSQGSSGGTGYVLTANALGNHGTIYSEPAAPETTVMSFASGALGNQFFLLNGTTFTDSNSPTSNQVCLLADNPGVGTSQGQCSLSLLTSSGFLTWNNDTGFHRIGAGTVGVDNTPGTGTGIISANGYRISNSATTGHALKGNGSNFVDSGGSVPNLFACGTTTTCANTDTGSTARIIYGSCPFSASTSCSVSSITAFTNSFFCTVSDSTATGLTFKVVNIGLNSFTITASASTSDVVSYICSGN